MKRAMRFGISIAACVAAVGTIGAIAAHALGRLDVSLERTIDRDVERLLALDRARQQFRAMNALERDAIFADAPEELAAIIVKLDDASVALEAQLHHYAGLMPSDDTPLLAAVDGASARWLGVDVRVRATALHNREEALALAKLHRFDDAWESAFDTLTEANQRRLAAQVVRVEQDHLQVVSWLVALSAGAGLLGFAYGRKPRV
ncbi:MAG TPA: hypothetical protein VHZ95_19310, partial [Polyangiales bacterium]|nr:hypothetical protein [Polyangiales bacterium]